MGKIFIGLVIFFIIAVLLYSQGKMDSNINYYEEVELMNVYVNVTDKKNNFVNNLLKEDFIIMEDGRKQKITNFSIESPPLSIILIMDISASMLENVGRNISKFDIAKNAALSFIKKMRSYDTYRMISIEDYAYESCKRNLSFFDLRRELLFLEAKLKNTALFDGIFYGSELLEKEKASRKVLILFSDGLDTASRITYQEALNKTLAVDVAIFGFVTANLNERSGMRGYATIEEMAKYTGGKIVAPSNINEIDGAIKNLENELFNVYSIAYKPPQNGGEEKKFRKIIVEVNRSDVYLRYRKGYIR